MLGKIIFFSIFNFQREVLNSSGNFINSKWSLQYFSQESPYFVILIQITVGKTLKNISHSI